MTRDEIERQHYRLGPLDELRHVVVAIRLEHIAEDEWTFEVQLWGGTRLGGCVDAQPPLYELVYAPVGGPLPVALVPWLGAHLVG